MKLRFLFLFTAALALASCGGNPATSDSNSGDAQHLEEGAHTHADDSAAAEASDTHQGGKEYTSAYVCPMHCEGSGSDQPGACPVCGMDYVARAEHVADGHGHE